MWIIIVYLDNQGESYRKADTSAFAHCCTPST